MCETTVYLKRNGESEKILEDVQKVEVSPEGVKLHKLFEAPLEVPVVFHEFDAQEHTLTLTPLLPSAVHEWIMKRRSIRKYTEAQVSDEQVDILLQAAMAAPSADDLRPWAFVVVRDPDYRKALAEIHAWSYMCASASAVIVVVGEPSASDHWVEDCSAATENLLLAAAGLGLGSVWVAVYPRTEREARVRKLLNIPEHMRVLCLLPIGYPAETKPARTRYEASKVFHETFSRRK